MLFFMSHQSPSNTMTSLKQILFLRNDLSEFPVGSLVAQGCHASVAAIERFKDHPNTQKYLEMMLEMTTIVLGIEESQIEKICADLDKLGVGYHLWLEEGLPTCIATIPMNIGENKKFDKYRKKYNLFANKSTNV